MREIKFTVQRPGGDRIHHVSVDDIKVVISRLPEDVYDRLKHVHLNDRSWGARVLGYVNSGRREIGLCALPPRVSFTRAMIKGQKPEDFGARRGAQWPELAIRRFILYDVFLHELGHLQIIDPKAKGEMRKFAREPKAEEFANTWRMRMWANQFDHDDLVHNPPSKQEIKALFENS